jgi:hypothetical protein
VNPTVYPKDWPVKGGDFEVLVIPEPITNYRILPFTENIENGVKSDTISITAAKDSYEPASFVIRSGDVDLKDVIIEVTDLKAEIKGKGGKINKAIIPKENIDVRVVKCWYQAGGVIYDTRNKVLVPELLLHDDQLISVNYEKQVNIIRDIESIADAKKLKPFFLQRKQNKQVWLTVSIPENAVEGEYSGVASILHRGGGKRSTTFTVTVLGFKLPAPFLRYSLYYTGRYLEDFKGRPNASYKTEIQLFSEVRDMIAHGITNPTVYIDHETLSNGTQDLRKLNKVLELRKKAGILDMEPLLYIDLKLTHSETPERYRRKIEAIVDLAGRRGLKEVYIYGEDEASGEKLAKLAPIYKVTQNTGAKNFVAGTLRDFLKYTPDVIDLFVVNGMWDYQNGSSSKDTPDSALLSEAKKLGKKVWLYNYPQAGMEEPATYRKNFGVNLWLMGMDGACNFAYQSYVPWNDFTSAIYRSHTMAYPTEGEPIPTVQWEGWRSGVNDVRYLTLLVDTGANIESLNNLNKTLAGEKSAERLRQKILEQVLTR